MFDQLIESGGMHLSARKPLTLTLALVIHGMVISSLILAPLILPPSMTNQIAGFLAAIGHQLPPLLSPSNLKLKPNEHITNLITQGSLTTSPIMIAPGQIPPRIPPTLPDATEAPQGVYPGELAPAVTNNLPLWYSMVSENQPAVPRPEVKQPEKPKTEQQVVRIRQGGEIQEANLIRRILPVYPKPAKISRIQGKVVMEAIISPQGAIEDLRVISGPPLLITAAMEAVKQWRYRPTFLNGVPCQVETTITVNFILDNA